MYYNSTARDCARARARMAMVCLPDRVWDSGPSAQITSVAVGRWAASLKQTRAITVAQSHDSLCTLHFCTLHISPALWAADPSCVPLRLAFLPTPAFRFHVLPHEPRGVPTRRRLESGDWSQDEVRLCVRSFVDAAFHCISFHFISGAAADQAIPTHPHPPAHPTHARMQTVLQPQPQPLGFLAYENENSIDHGYGHGYARIRICTFAVPLVPGRRSAWAAGLFDTRYRC